MIILATGFTRGYSWFDPCRVFPILQLSTKKTAEMALRGFCIYFRLLKLTTQLTYFFTKVEDGIGVACVPLFQSAGILDRHLVLYAWKDPGGIAREGIVTHIQGLVPFPIIHPLGIDPAFFQIDQAGIDFFQVVCS